MLNLKEAIREDIKEGLKAVVGDGELPDVVVERPAFAEASAGKGDYASPIALRLASLAQGKGKNPMDIVKAIVEHMPKKEYIGRLTAAEPGFLNIRLNPGWLTARLDNVIGEDLCGGINVGEDKSVNLEFISANPTGPLTLANARTAFSVDTLGKVLECAGFNVTREYYFNDAGAQVGRLGESVLRRILEAGGENIEFSGELYQGEYIKELAMIISEKWQENEGKKFTAADLENKEVMQKISEEAVEIELEQIKRVISEVLKIEFDVWTSERSLRQDGIIEETLKKLEERRLTYKKDGAVYLKTTQFGDDQDRVLVKSDGEYAYIAPDIGYHQNKYDRGFDHIVTVVGADHQGHLPKIKAAMAALGNDVSKLRLVAAQWLRLIREGRPVKISKRRGFVITPKDLIDEVGYDAARFFLVQHRLDSHMDFDLDLAKERSERNPVYYVQYAYVRLQSILRQAKQRGVISKVGEVCELTDSPALTHTYELNLMRQLYRFSEVVSDIANSFDVHDLCYFAQDVSRAVHVFYRHVPVLAAEEEKLVTGRLQLVLAARSVLGRTLDLLGIGKPDIM
ncbi:MAG: arginine--tRNA ligase [bacterium]